MSTQQFGGWLRHAREARGLTVEAIASQTKIPPRHVEALERGDALPLPAFYQRAEIRAVARAVGVDERLALARLEAEQAPVDPPPVPSRPARVRSEHVLSIVVMSVLVVGLAGWGSFGRTLQFMRAAKTPEPATAPPAVPLAIDVSSGPLVETMSATAARPIGPVGPTELVVQTQPEGARVTVNGIGWGESPITVRHLEPGEQRIRVTMDGYAATERSVSIDEGSRRTVVLRLSSAGPSS